MSRYICSQGRRRRFQSACVEAASDPFLAGTIQRQRAPATSALRQGQGRSPLSRTPFSAGGVLPELRAHSDGERRSLACCSKLDFSVGAGALEPRGDHLQPVRAYLRDHYRVAKVFSNGDQIWERTR